MTIIDYCRYKLNKQLSDKHILLETQIYHIVDLLIFQEFGEQD